MTEFFTPNKPPEKLNKDRNLILSILALVLAGSLIIKLTPEESVQLNQIEQNLKESSPSTPLNPIKIFIEPEFIDQLG